MESTLLSDCGRLCLRLYYIQSDGLTIVIFCHLQDGLDNTRVVKEVGTVVRANQHRMAMDPFETLLINMGYQMQGTFLNSGKLQTFV